MHRRMTITLDEAVYEGLYRRIGKRRISQFIEDLVRPHVLDTSLDDGYRAMAADKEREVEALEWCNALTGDLADETRLFTWECPSKFLRTKLTTADRRQNAH
jgi:hypothetical protein